MTSLGSREAVAETKRYLYGLMAVNIGTIGVIVAFFFYHGLIQDRALDKIVGYHTSTARAAQAGLAEIQRISDLLLDGAKGRSGNSAQSGAGPAGDPVADTVTALIDERDVILALHERYADPEFDKATIAAADAFDAALRASAPERISDTDISEQLELLETLALRLEQLSRLHMAARDKLADMRQQGLIADPNSLLVAVGLLAGLGGFVSFQVARNVTRASVEREAALAALRSSETDLARVAEGFRTAQRIARVGSWEWRVGSEVERWSDQAFRNLGLEPGCFEPTVAKFHERVHPDDLEKCSTAVQRAVADKTGYDLDFRVVWPDGSVRIMREHAEPVLDDNGTIVALLGTMQDVTAERDAELQAGILADRLSGAQRIAGLGNWEWDADTKDEWWSDEIYRIFGIEPGSIAASYETFMARVHPDDRDRLVAAIEATQSGKAPPYTETFRILQPDGSERVVRESGEALFSSDGQLLGLSGTIQDITEQYAAQQELARLASSLAGAQRIARIGSWEWDAETGIEWWSDESYRIIGLEPRQVEAKQETFLQTVHEHDRDRVARTTDEAERNETGYTVDFRLVLPDGSERYAREIGECVFDEEGRFTGQRGTIQDITEEHIAARRLAESARRLEAAQRIARVANWEWDPDSDLLDWPPQMREVLGLPPDDEPISNDDFVAMLHPDDREPLLELMQRAVRDGTPYSMEYRFVPPDGAVRTIMEYAEPFAPDREGKAWLRGTIQDITDRKQAEAELAAANQLLADAQHMASIGSWTFDTLTGAVRWTEELYRIYGIEPRKHPPTRDTFLNYVHADDYSRIQESVQAALASGSTFDETYRIVRADGEVRVLHARGEWQPNPSGARHVLTGTTQDITDRKKAEDAVRASEARLDAFFAAAPAGLALYDSEGRYIKINNTLATDHGLPVDDHIGKRPSDILPIEFARILEEGNKRTLKTGEQVVNTEISAPTPNGEDGEIHYVYSRFPIYGLSGTISGIGVVTVNISARKNAERQLARAAENLNRAQRLARVGSWERDIVNNRDEWSDECYRIHGLEPGSVELTGRDYLNYVHAEDREAVRAAHERALSDDTPLSVEFRLRGADGRDRVVHTHGEVERDGDGRPIRMSGTVQDITERRIRERELRETEQRFSLAFQLSPGMTAISEIETGIHVDVNDKWVDTMGYSREEAVGRTALELGVWADPEDRARAVAMLRKDGRFRDFEAQYRTRGGVLRDFLISAETFPIGDRPHMLIVAHDITEWKRAEQAIRESEARLDAFFSAAPAGMGIIDADYRYVRLNETLALMNGPSVAEHIGKRAPEILAPEIAGFAESVMRRTLECGETIINEQGSAKRPDGTVQHWVFSQFPIPGAKPGETALGVIVIDTTELKNAQEELARLNAELERRVEDRTAELRAAQSELVRSERLATLGQLTATVSHELRNPLGAMRTSLYVIEKKADQEDERMAKAVARVNRSITRCDRIIDELLDFTRIRELDLEYLAIDAWLGALLDEQPVPEGVRLHRKLGAADIRVPADPDRLRRAVINVYENACQAMTKEPVPEIPKGGHNLMVSTRAVGNRLEMIFEDTGPGIAKKSTDRIFEPLFSTKNFGVGLGLPVVRQIMEQHGGGIEAGNRRSRGAKFVLWLPRERQMEDTEV